MKVGALGEANGWLFQQKRGLLHHRRRRTTAAAPRTGGPRRAPCDAGGARAHMRRAHAHRHNTAVFDLGSIGTRTLAANGN